MCGNAGDDTRMPPDPAASAQRTRAVPDRRPVRVHDPGETRRGVEEVRARTRLRVPAERVFDFLLDSRHDPLWCPMVAEVTLVEGPPGPGARYRFEQRQGPGLPTVTGRLRTVEAARPHRIVWDNDGHGLPYVGRMDLAEHGDWTHVRHVHRVTFGSRAAQLGWWLVSNVVLRLQLRNLRRELER